MSKKVFNDYLEKVHEIHVRGDAREESFYPAFLDLMNGLIALAGRPEIKVTVQPRPTEAGNPDFRVWDGRYKIVGYIESKTLGTMLDPVEQSEQIKRYLKMFPNLILTNFTEFRLYRDGKRINVAWLCSPNDAMKGRGCISKESLNTVSRLIDRFMGYSYSMITTPQSLSEELAKRTRLLRDVVHKQLKREQKAGNGEIYGFYAAFKEYLIGDLKAMDFADMYAQTIAYGLFAAKVQSQGAPVTRTTAVDFIPQTTVLLHDMFQFISLGNLSDDMKWTIDDITRLLSSVDVASLMKDDTKDPVLHFYETFLASYDPHTRKQKGVYYTPDPIVSYIVKSVDHILKDKFGKRNGLGDKDVTLLDPAAGTMTFVAKATELAVNNIEQSSGSGYVRPMIKEHILEDFHAFELMMAPYAIGHLKMATLLKGLGYTLQKGESVKLYLTNALDLSQVSETFLPGLSSLTRESKRAERVKTDTQINVILGNPPYSVHSTNNGAWIKTLVDDYKYIDGEPLGEKNLSNLQDDYVKFIRFAQFKINQAGRGVVGFIVNHTWLDAPTFRGMRWNLMQAFDEIYVLDLHGNSLRKEKTPDGDKDENVFNIRQGVAIVFLVRTGDEKMCKIYHADLWGRRDEKYNALSNNDISTTKWERVNIDTRFHFFINVTGRDCSRYNRYKSVNELFQVHASGVKTGRDKLCIQFSPQEMRSTITRFVSLDPEEAREEFCLGQDTQQWSIENAQRDLLSSELRQENIVPIMYRPFDVRYTYHSGTCRGFHREPRRELASHIVRKENVGLCLGRQISCGNWAHIFVFTILADISVLSNRTREGASLFPLYLFNDDGSMSLNLHPRLLTDLRLAYSEPISPSKVLWYIYAVLYTPLYRERYAGYLRYDFPRIPFPERYEWFDLMATWGKRLVDLHLLRDQSLDSVDIRFEGVGGNRVAKNKGEGFRYDADEQQVYINKTQYFAPVPKGVWEYRIGGYQVAHKWLKDRRGRVLTLDEVNTYRKVLKALEETIEVQVNLNRIYEKVEQKVMDLSDF